MSINNDKPELWKADIALSVDMYNQWFLRFAPKAYRETRELTTVAVEETLTMTRNLLGLDESVLYNNPSILPTLRMCTCPPLAVDRLIGLADVSPGLVKTIEKHTRIPPRMSRQKAQGELQKLVGTIEQLLDRDIFVWYGDHKTPKSEDVRRAATIVADRLCGSQANPIIRNAQETRQLEKLGKWLTQRGYEKAASSAGIDFTSLPPGTFAFRMNVPVKMTSGPRELNIPVDAIVMPKTPGRDRYPVLIEAKSAGDFTNVNKRRKEEAAKMEQLRRTYGKDIRYLLFLCGYFDTGYLGYEAAEGIDWIWEHRMDDLAKTGL